MHESRVLSGFIEFHLQQPVAAYPALQSEKQLAKRQPVEFELSARSVIYSQGNLELSNFVCIECVVNHRLGLSWLLLGVEVLSPPGSIFWCVSEGSRQMRFLLESRNGLSKQAF